MSLTKEERRGFARSGLPLEPDLGRPLPKRLLTSRLAWLTVVMLLVYVTLLALLYQQSVPDQQVNGGRVVGLGTEAVPIAAKYAAITAIPLSLLFLWAAAHFFLAGRHLRGDLPKVPAAAETD